MATTLELWNKVSAFPKGKWTFSRMLCLKAPYFGSISPLFIELKPNYCKFPSKRSVLCLTILEQYMQLPCVIWLNWRVEQ